MATTGVALVTGVLKKLGFDAAVQLPETQGRGWLLQTQAAVMFVLVEAREGEGEALRLTCPLLYMPSEELLPFYRKLLDVNNSLPGAALALDRDIVCLVAQQSLDGLAPAAVEVALARTFKEAEALGELLMREFPNARFWSPM